MSHRCSNRYMNRVAHEALDVRLGILDAPKQERPRAHKSGPLMHKYRVINRRHNRRLQVADVRENRCLHFPRSDWRPLLSLPLDQKCDLSQSFVKLFIKLGRYVIKTSPDLIPCRRNSQLDITHPTLSAIAHLYSIDPNDLVVTPDPFTTNKSPESTSRM